MVAMEPASEVQKPTFEAAREKARQRLDKVVNFALPLLAPKEYLQAGMGVAQEKATVFGQRAEKAAIEVANEMVASIEDSVDTFLVQPYEAVKKRSTEKANVFLKWGLGLGLPVLGKVEAAFQKVSGVIDDFREWRTQSKENKAQALKEKWERASQAATESRATVTETRESTKRMTAIREMAASLKA